MTKLLVASYFFPPFNGPGAQHPDFFHRYLGEYGFDSTAVASAIYFNSGASPSPAPERKQGVLHLPESGWARSLCPRLYKTEMQIQVRMGYWEPGFVWAKLFASPAAEKLIEQGRFDAVISVSPPIASHWLALRLKRRFPKLIWIADFQDPFLGNPFHKNPGRRQLAFERDLFSHADILSANTDTVLEMWRRRYPEYAGKMTTTWGGYDPEEVVQAEPLASATAVLSHVGSLYGARIPTVLLQSIERLDDRGLLRPTDLTVEFVGELDFGPATDLARRLETRGFLKLRSNYVPRTEALRIAGQAHYSLLLDITPGNDILQVPAKLFDQIRIGRPILAFTPEDSPAGRILAGSGIEYRRLKPDAAPEDVDRAVLELVRLAPDSRKPTEWFLENFDARCLVRQLAGLIQTRLDQRDQETSQQSR